jgi:hypothetical protein
MNLLTVSSRLNGFICLFTCGLLTTSLNAQLTINATWGPGVERPAEVDTVWASVASYYTSIFSDSTYAGQTWNVSLNYKVLSGGIAEGGPVGGYTLGSSLAAQPGALTSRIRNDVYYASTLANYLSQNAAFVSGTNIEVSFDSNTSWDYSTNSKASDKESLYATAIHEIGHGLGFFSNDRPADGTFGGKPVVFDGFLSLGAGGTNLIGMSSENLQAAFISNNVYWTGTNGNTAHGSAVKIYSPSPYEDGSSMSHLDFSVDPALSLMMYPSDAPGLPLAYSYSATELGMWKDMGYTVVPEPAGLVLVLFAGGFLLVRAYIRRRILGS